MRIPLLLLVVLTCWVHVVSAQNSLPDSATRVALANKYARGFRLSEPMLKEFNEQRFPSTSDYFKPVPKKTIKPVLLTDSVFVQTYRMSAFLHTLNQRERPTLGSPFKHPPLPGIGRPAPDYTDPTQQMAQKDAGKFRLGEKEIVQFKTRPFPNTSDYFKPTPKYTADTAMLKDSVYVRTFRNEAFDQARQQPENPKAQTFIIATIAVVAAVVLVLLIGNTQGN